MSQFVVQMAEFIIFISLSVLFSAVSYNIKIKKIKKFQNKMQVATVLQPQLKQDFRLENLELSSLFLHTKKITKQLICSKQVKEKNDVGLTEKCRKLIRQVLQFIVSKISDSKRLKIDEFIALISIYVYANVAVDGSQSFGLQFSEQFYWNVQRYVEKIILDWNGSQSDAQKKHSQLNLSILLCSLSSLIQQSQKNICQLNYYKIFSSSNLKQILSLKLPNEEKFIKHYRNLVLYFNKLNFSLTMKKKLMKSLSYSLIHYSGFKNMQLTSIFLLNKYLQEQKFVGKINEIWHKNELQQIFAVCVNLILEEKEFKPVQIKLVLEFCFKIVSKLPQVCSSVINVQKFLRLFQYSSKHLSQTERLNPCIQNILSKMSNESQQYIMSMILSDSASCFSTIQLQFLEVTSKKISQKSASRMLQEGYWQRLILLLQEINFSINSSYKTLQPPNGQGLNYRKYLLSRIVNNVIRSCSSSSDIGVVLKNLYQMAVGVYEIRQE